MANENIPGQAHTVTELQESLRQVDMYAQTATERISTLAKVIIDNMTKPDSHDMRTTVKTMAEMIDYLAFDTMNAINNTAGHAGADYQDSAEDALVCAIHAAVKPATVHQH